MSVRATFFLSGVLGLFLGVVPITFAQTSCGEFVVVEEFEGEPYIERTPIEDCDNPFKADEPPPYIPTLKLGQETVSDGDEVTLPVGESVSIFGQIEPDPEYLRGSLSIYQASGTDYYFVEQGLVEETLTGNFPPGAYVAVFNRSFKPVLGTNESWLKRLWRGFLPATAYAYYASDIDEIVTISFSVTSAAPEPTGASSILFLPGIMGSHLYEDNDECLGLGEQQRWFSHTDCEQLRLLTNQDGSSVHDVYTKFEDESIADQAALFFVTQELYTNFLQEMNELEAARTIKTFTPFPYDWRLRLDQIIKMKREPGGRKVRYDASTTLQDGLLYQTISQMAELSYSGKVTIVSHSNGGLVAKAFMAALAEANDPLEDKIDNLILIGSPQVGTPDAVNGILHGTEIGPGGLVITQETTRKILNTAPFGHHLLPNKYYFEGEGVAVDTPVISFKEGLATNALRSRFGPDITSFEQLATFLDDSSGRSKPVVSDLKNPEVVEGTLLTYAQEIADTLANWQPPETLTVHQIGGSGVWTPARIEYFSNEYCLRTVPIGFTCDAYTGQLDYELHGVYDGDGTVVLPSALAMSEADGVKRWWLDLDSYSREVKQTIHKNMMEIPEVSAFVTNISAATSSPYSYIADTAPPVPEDIRLVFHLHSPLDMYVTSDQGTVSSSTNQIPGAFYRRFGDMQYISLPKEITGAQLHLVGYESGSFTLFQEVWQGEEEVSTVDFKALPTSSTTVVTLPVSFEQVGVMQVDYNGDGVVDGTVSEQEDVIQALVSLEPEPLPEESQASSGGSAGTRVRSLPGGLVAGASTIETTEQLKEIIRLLRLLIELLSLEKNT